MIILKDLKLVKVPLNIPFSFTQYIVSNTLMIMIKMQQKVLDLVAKIDIFVWEQCLGLGAEFKKLVKATFQEQLCPRHNEVYRYPMSSINSWDYARPQHH